MAIPAGMRRMSLDLARSLRDRLESAAEGDGVPAPARVRALVTLWESDPHLQDRAARLAMTQQSEARARAVRTRRATLARRRQQDTEQALTRAS